MTAVIPAYNARRFIREAIASALAQSYPSLEIVMVDDGSSDDTAAIAEACARDDHRIRVIRQENAGVGAARNRGIAAARGEFVAPLDADDLWHPEKIQRQVDALQRAGPRHGFCYCWSMATDEDGGNPEPVVHWPVEGDALAALVYRNFVGNASVPLFRTAAVREAGGYATRADQGGAQGCEDWDLALRIAGRHHVAQAAAYLVDYRRTNQSMTSHLDRMIGSYEFAIARLRRDGPPVPEKLFRWSAGHFYLYMLNIAYAAGDYPQSLRLLAKTLAADPFTVLSPSMYRILAMSVIRSATGRKIFHRPHERASTSMPKRILWIPAHWIEKQRWRAIREGRV